jgi:hypothetical protein
MHLAITSTALAQSSSTNDGWVEDPNVTYIAPPATSQQPATTSVLVPQQPLVDPSATADPSPPTPTSDPAQAIPMPQADPAMGSAQSSAVPTGKSKGNWFTNPPPLGWLGSATKSAKNAAKKTADSTKTVLQSPMFWGGTLAAGGMVGLYFLNKAHNKGDQSNPQDHYVRGYYDRNGFWHSPHRQTNADDALWNNYGYSGNFNPNIGKFSP